MAEDEKYKNKYEAIMAWLDSLLDKEEKEKPKKIRLKKGEKSLAEQINWAGKFEKRAKGGLLMDEQMSMFNEGGLLDEGGEVDEESGNDVPIGGT